MRRGLAFTATAAAAFTASAPAFAARGASVAIDHDALVAYAADSDAAALHRIDLADATTTTIALPCAPEQVAVLDTSHVAVTLRACNELAIVAIDEAGDGAVEAEIPVAVDPYGVAASDTTILVTSGYAHALTLVDRASLATKSVIDVGREPRGIALSKDGKRAFLGHAVGGAITRVDLDGGGEGEGANAFAVSVLNGAYRNRVEKSAGAGTMHPTSSLAFAPVFNDDETRLFVPHLIVQNGGETTTVVAGSYGGVAIEENTSFAAVEVLSPSGDAMALPKAPAVPRARVSEGFFGAAAVAPVGSPARQVRSSAVLGDALYVTSLGTNQLVELDARSLDPSLAARRSFDVGAGPTGVDVDRALDIAAVWSQFDHELAIVDLASGDVDRIPVVSAPMDAIVDRGRRLFHTELDPRISRDGRACAACHPDGRDDGLVWKLGVGPRQTPTLVGRVHRGPFGWIAKHDKLEDNMAETMTRLGGTGLSKDDLTSLAAFVRTGLRAPSRPKVESDEIERGRAVFTSPEVGCSGCHAPETEMSDRKKHDVGSRSKTDEMAEFRTPPLLFVGDTAPYFHDGRYPTLEALLDDNLDRMGNTSQLSAGDRSALLAYLRSL